MTNIIEQARKVFCSTQVLFDKQQLNPPNLKTNFSIKQGVLYFFKPQSQVQRLGAMLRLIQQKPLADVEQEYQEDERDFEQYPDHQGHDEDQWVTDQQDKQQLDEYEQNEQDQNEEYYQNQDDQQQDYSALNYNYEQQGEKNKYSSNNPILLHHQMI